MFIDSPQVRGFLVCDAWTNKYFRIAVDMPSTLTAMDANTAECQFQALSSMQSRVPERLSFESCFDHNVRVAVVDRGTANIRLEKSLQTKCPNTVTLLMTCDVHKMAGALKYAMKRVDSTVSGIIHTGLATSNPSSVVTLRSILQRIFDKELEIVLDDPPPQFVQHTTEVFNLFCPVDSNSAASGRNARRQYILRRLANSNICERRIIHYCGYQCCPSPEYTRNAFLQNVTWALVPNKLKVIQRKSWTGADESFQWLSMLHSFWGLWQRTVETFTGRPTAAPATVAEDSVPSLDDHLQMAASGSLDWAAMNRRYASIAVAFSKEASLLDAMTCATILLQPAMSLIRGQLDMAGEDWEKRQQHESLQGRSRTYRVVEKAAETLLHKCFSSVFQILFEVPPGLPLQSYTHNVRSLLFRLLPGFVCALEFTMRRYSRSFPDQLFTLLKGSTLEAIDNVHRVSCLC